MHTNRRRLSSQGKQALLSACYEYLLIISPVGIYVFLEGIHKHDSSFYWSSPEWAIATIFLLFQGLALYKRDVDKTGRKLTETAFGLFLLITVLVIIIASINAYQSLHVNTPGLIGFRLGLFGVISVAFILLVGGGRLVYLRKEQEKNG